MFEKRAYEELSEFLTETKNDKQSFTSIGCKNQSYYSKKANISLSILSDVNKSLNEEASNMNNPIYLVKVFLDQRLSRKALMKQSHQ